MQNVTKNLYDMWKLFPLKEKGFAFGTQVIKNQPTQGEQNETTKIFYFLCSSVPPFSIFPVIRNWSIPPPVNSSYQPFKWTLKNALLSSQMIFLPLL